MTDELTPVMKVNLKTKTVDFAVRTMPYEVDDILMICLTEGLITEGEAGMIRINYALIMIGGRHLN